MTTWEYALLHQLTWRRGTTPNVSALGTAFVVEDRTGVKVLDDADGFLAAFNAVGAEGWLVQTPAGPYGSNNRRSVEMIKTLLNVDHIGGSTNVMRRSRN